MDELARQRLAGQLTAHRVLLEHLYMLVLRYVPEGRAWARDLQKLQLELLDEVPPANAAELTPEWGYAVSQHALHHLEQFWDRVGRTTDIVAGTGAASFPASDASAPRRRRRRRAPKSGAPPQE